MKKKGRGLSFDEKRDKILKIFHTQKTVFNYEEIQKLSVKAGVPFPVVKDILNSLKADNLIECEKIGAGVFYWSFPSRAYQIIKERILYTARQIEATQNDIKSLGQKIQSSRFGRQLTEERQQCYEKLQRSMKQRKKIEQEVNKFIRYDPERVELLKKQNRQLKENINEWTDNIEQAKKFIRKMQPGITGEEMENAYGILTDIDYIE